MTIASWEPIAADLAADYQVIRCDFRGQLLSPGPPHFSLDGHVDDVVRLLDLLGIHDLHVLGTSFGGEVALLLAARYPERVRSLVVLTATDEITDEMRRSSRALIELSEKAARGGDGGAVFRAVAKETFSSAWLETQSPEFIEQRAAQFAQLPASYYEGVAGLMRALESMDLTDDLPRISIPTLILGAELDRVFPVEHSRSLAASIPGAELRILDGSGHGVVVETPGTVVAELREFHARLSPRT